MFHVPQKWLLGKYWPIKNLASLCQLILSLRDTSAVAQVTEKL